MKNNRWVRPFQQGGVGVVGGGKVDDVHRRVVKHLADGLVDLFHPVLFCKGRRLTVEHPRPPVGTGAEKRQARPL